MKAATAIAGTLSCLAWGCTGPHAVPGGTPPPNAEIYQRATNQFAQADFFKPAEAKTNELAFALAPLILQEVTGADGSLCRSDSFGTLSLANGLWVLDCSHPTVYWQADTITLHGKVHARLAYCWFYSLDGARSKRAPYRRPADQDGKGLAMQGVRLTLNSAGQPAIWEALTDCSGAELIFVSEGLEAAAAGRFGKPLAGRRHAIERSMVEAPGVVVARVIDDGPVAMGPIVYLSAGTREVSTLICRCMPAQARTLRATVSYDLLPLPAIPGELIPLPPGGWAGDAATDNRLEKWLRLPEF